MKLSNYEKETIIFWNEAEKIASVYILNITLQGQLAVLCESYPEQVRRGDEKGHGGLTFELPKKWLKITPPRVLSPAQREVIKRMNEKRWGGDSYCLSCRLVESEKL